VTEARLDTVSALTLHIRKRQSDALTEQLAALHELDKQAPFADEIMPADELLISHYADAPNEHTHELQSFLSIKSASPQPGVGGVITIQG